MSAPFFSPSIPYPPFFAHFSFLFVVAEQTNSVCCARVDETDERNSNGSLWRANLSLEALWTLGIDVGLQLDNQSK